MRVQVCFLREIQIQKYEVIVAGKLILVDMMGQTQFFNVDVQNKVMEANELARFQGTHQLYGDENVVLGTVTIGYDGSATAPVNGVQKEGTICYKSGYLYFYYGEYDLLVIDYTRENDVITLRLSYAFQGSDYEENSAFESYVGTYELQMHGDTLNTIQFMSNGTFLMYGDSFMTVLGRYEITETGLTIYYFGSEDWMQEIVYDQASGRYILRDIMNQNGGMGTTQPEEKQ